MNNSLTQKSDRAVGLWLLTGVGMIMIQVLLGGITRLTESGLSITEWKPIFRMFPPVGNEAWMAEFDKYKNTDQFKYIHADFTLSDFKFIFFWEWFHRIWAQLLGFVFIIGFVYFIWKKKFRNEMIIPFVILFLLGAVQGAIGWIMVKSGLVPEMYFVGHIELATHFVAALVLLVYTLWFALTLLIPQQHVTKNTALKRMAILLIIILFVQLIYGGFMAGLKAGTVAATWPTINGEWFPDSLFITRGKANYFNNPFMVQFIHRGIAYLFTILVLIWFIKAKAHTISSLFNRTKLLPVVLVVLQVILGILTVLYSTNATAIIWFGVLHQFVAMLLVMSLIWVLYLVKK